tara:strand:+ start:744 stop:1226 length:483 start_codon:yes stop_codon:yes gene_type:complete
MANKLTAKQMAFARCMASGTMTQSAAYRETYSAGNMSGAVVRNEASRLMANHDIAIMVERLIGEQERSLLAQGLSDKDKVLEKLRTWIDSAEPTDSNKLRAAELLGKSVGLFKEVTATVSIDRDAESVASEIERRIGSLLTASQEQEPEQVIPSENDSLH